MIKGIRMKSLKGIRLENITKKYSKNIIALKNINLNIDDGEFVVLVGPSGCGKSTALRIIAGMLGIFQCSFL